VQTFISYIMNMGKRKYTSIYPML